MLRTTGDSGREHLQGEWRVECLGGLLPSMIGVRKRIQDGRGETGVGALSGWPFRIERRGEIVVLVYSPPPSMLVDGLRTEQGGSRFGRSVLGGRELGLFRRTRVQR